eukprot:INCI18120.1.p1 GENE.INCI18120.1~~INCI18120.1.p1  ORF type:complete len:984 (+),score=135.12 INCI18120.1:210-3161(+)
MSMDYEQLCRLQDKLVGAGSYLYKYPCEGFRSAELAEASKQPIGALLGNPKQYWVQVAEGRTLFWRKAPTAKASSRRQVPLRDVDAVCQGVRIIARARPIVAGQFRLCFTVTLSGSRCLIFRAPSVRVLQTWIESINRVVFDFGRPPERVLNDNLLRTITGAASDDPRFCDEISALLTANASVNARNVSGRTALTVAAKKGNLGALRLLLQRGADCNDKTFGSGETPLHAAILARSPACVLELAAQPGIDVDCIFGGKEQISAVHIASQCRDEDVAVLEALVEKGANVQSLDCYGRTPLHFACQTDSVAATAVLCDMEPDLLDFPDYSGNCPLHIAATTGSVRCVQLLLETAASPSERNATGQTPYDIAKLAGNNACARALAAYRRTPNKSLNGVARKREVQQDYPMDEGSDYTAAGASFLDDRGTDGQQYDENDPSYNSYYGGENYATDDQYSGYYAEDGSYVDAGGKVYNIADSEGWMRCMTEDGHDYFYNEVTEESQWEPPASYVDQDEEYGQDYPAGDHQFNDTEQRDTVGGEEHAVPSLLSNEEKQAAEQLDVAQRPNKIHDHGSTVSLTGTSTSPGRSPDAPRSPVSHHSKLKPSPSQAHQHDQIGTPSGTRILPAASPTAGARTDSKTYLGAQSNYSPETSPSGPNMNFQAKQHLKAAWTQGSRDSLGDQTSSAPAFDSRGDRSSPARTPTGQTPTRRTSTRSHSGHGHHGLRLSSASAIPPPQPQPDTPHMPTVRSGGTSSPQLPSPSAVSRLGDASSQVGPRLPATSVNGMLAMPLTVTSGDDTSSDGDVGSSANASRSQSPDMPPPLQTLLASGQNEGVPANAESGKCTTSNAATTNAPQSTAMPAAHVARVTSGGQTEDIAGTIVAADAKDDDSPQISSPPMTPTKNEEGSSARTPTLTERIDINVVDDSYQFSATILAPTISPLNALDLARSGKAQSYTTERQRQRQLRRQKLRASSSANHGKGKFFDSTP